jgi:hypothetical protein
MPASCATKALLLRPGSYTGPQNTRIELKGKESVAIVGPVAPAPLRVGADGVAEVDDTTAAPPAADVATIDGEGAAWLFAVGGSAILWLTHVVLARGRGGQFGAVSGGGALSITGSGSVNATGVLFDSNTASPTTSGSTSVSGGAVIISSDGAALVNGCLFRNNNAEGSGSCGGGVNVQSNSAASAASVAPVFDQCLFEENSAVNGGGAYVVNAEPCFRTCTWRSNTATGRSGGGVFVASDPTASNAIVAPVFELCLFEGNSAMTNGGGAHVEDAAPHFSTCTWRNNAVMGSFSTVHGGRLHGGGGVFVGSFIGAAFTITFETAAFTGNTVAGKFGGGGAVATDVLVADVPANLAFEAGQCRLRGGDSGGFGGYNCVLPSEVAYPPPSIDNTFRQWIPRMQLIFTGSTTFDGNVATAASGGALSVGQGGSVVINASATFRNNRAATFGGATYLAAGSASLTLLGPSTWANNSAGSARGDHLYSESNGAIALGDATLQLGGDPTRVREGVAAVQAGNVSWGGMSSAVCEPGYTLSASTDITTSTHQSWVLEGSSNGTAGFRNGSNCPGYFDYCNGVGLSKSANPTWAKSGLHDPKATPIFPPMLATRVSVGCAACGATEWSNATQPLPGSIVTTATATHPLSHTCAACAGRMSPGITCQAGVLIQKSGWWRPDAAVTGFGTRMFPCYTDTCVGSANEKVGLPSFGAQCTLGFAGPVCAVCAPDFVRRSGACVLCPRDQSGGAMASVTLICLAVVGVLALAYRYRRKLRVESFKIIVGFYSLLAVLGDTFGIRWPSVFVNVLAFIKAAFASFSQLSALACSLHIHHYAELYFWTIGLLGLLAAVAGWVFVKLQYSRQAALREQLPKALFYVLLFAYPLVCPPVISTFVCRTVDGTSYLVADYTLQCYTPAWNLAVAWCSLWVVAYVAGLPVAVVLAVQRHIPALAFVSDGYREHPLTQYWEVLEMGRKLLLSSAILLFEKGTSMQIAVATVLSVIFLILHALYEPFENPADNRLQTLALVSLFGTYFVGLLIKVQPSAGQSGEFAALLTGLSLVVIVGAVLNTGAHAAKQTTGLLARQMKRSDGEQGVEMDSVGGAACAAAATISNPAYEEGEAETAEALKAELASVKREHAKYTTARIAAELEIAQMAHKEELQAERQERERSAAQAERSAAEATKLRAELAQLVKLKKDE